MARIDEITEEEKDELKNWAYISDFNKMIHIHHKTIYGKRHSSHIMGLFMDVNTALKKKG